ncbi:MAG: hypothetical protein CL610_02595 [Anaerolineaceae bacterium]|nr:hypothetical protein [Anaerolineaceae bacterium]
MRSRIHFVLMLAVLAVAGCSGPMTWMQFVRYEPASPTVSGDPVHGQEIFAHGVNEAPPCSTCHQVVAGSSGFALGPNLAGLSSRAASRVEGMSAEAYIIDSILYPKDHIVSGFRDIMYADFAKHFSEQDMADLVAYLMTL